MRRYGSRWWKVVLATAVATLGAGVLPARADAGDAGRLLSLTNQVRASVGLPGLTMDGQLTSVAQAWAAELAGRGVISHNPSVRSQVSGWRVLGENVGVGGTAEAIHAGFVASPTHYANLVDPEYTKVGFGIVRPDARIFVVEVFMRPAAPPAAPTTAAPAPPPPPRVESPPVAPVPPAAPGRVASAPAASGPPAVTELSPWMVHSMDRLRSMEPAATG